MKNLEKIYQSIPQRPPFLFIDNIVEVSENFSHCQLTLSGKEDFFKGHFPNKPIMPGVLLQEATFQAGAVIISNGESKDQLGVVTKVEKAKFINFVTPGDILDIKVRIDEQIGNAFYMKGNITCGDKKILTIKFTCALVEEK